MSQILKQDMIHLQAATNGHTATDGQTLCTEPLKIAPEMAELMVYCKAVPFSHGALNSTIGFADFGNCEVELNSFNEDRAKELMVEGHRTAFQWRHRKYLSRVYPKVSMQGHLTISVMWS